MNEKLNETLVLFVHGLRVYERIFQKSIGTDEMEDQKFVDLFADMEDKKLKEIWGEQNDKV